jgi:hypothetical protein
MPELIIPSEAIEPFLLAVRLWSAAVVADVVLITIWIFK